MITQKKTRIRIIRLKMINGKKQNTNTYTELHTHTHTHTFLSHKRNDKIN